MISEISSLHVIHDQVEILTILEGVIHIDYESGYKWRFTDALGNLGVFSHS